MPNATKNTGFFRPFLRGLPIILGCMIAGIMLAKKYLRYTTPIYESTAKIKLADPHEGISNGNLYKDLDVFANTNKIGAEVELLKSKVLVAKAIAKLDINISYFRIGDIHKTELYDQCPFVVSASLSNPKAFDKPYSVVISSDSLVVLTSPSGEITKTKLNQISYTADGAIALKRNEALLQHRPRLAVNDRYEFIIHSESRLLNSIIADLDIMAVDKDVPVLRISYKSAVPKKAADVANALSAAYITDYIDEKFKSADTTSSFLDSQLKEYSQKLSASENRIEAYRNNNNIVNIRQETETDLRKIADLKKQLASVQMNLNAIDSLNLYMKNGRDHFIDLAPNFEAFTDLLSTELIKKTKELQREKRDLLTKYTPAHEKVRVVDDKLADIAAYMQESIHNTEKSLHIKYDDLERTIAESEKVFIGLPTREKNMTIMERNFGLNEQIYRFLSEKRTEAEIAKAATISFHRIISAGETPSTPVSPNTAIIKIMSAILGLISGVALIYGVHMVKARVNDEDTINRLSSIPVLTSIPFFNRNKQKEKAGFFRKWALQLQIKNLIPPGSVITISSYIHHEGKTFIARGLQDALTSMDRKTEYIHLNEDMQKQLSTTAAWSDYIGELRKSSDLIIIDNLPLHHESSALIPMATAELNMLILDSRQSRKDFVTETEQMQEDLKLPHLHFVLNRAGYIPSLLTQGRNLITQLLKKYRR